MISACVFATLLEYPGSPIRQAFPDPVLRRLLMGLAMAATAIGIIYSPWGKQSGAHINPSITLTFWYLGKIEHWDALFDALFYGVAQFLGAVTGTALVALVLGGLLSDAHVNYVVTMPGMADATMAFAVAAGISFFLMTVVLISSNNSRFARLTGLYCAALVALYITLAAPFSGMSMNPARSLLMESFS
jgi:aquaporin Z